MLAYGHAVVHSIWIKRYKFNYVLYTPLPTIIFKFKILALINLMPSLQNNPNNYLTLIVYNYTGAVQSDFANRKPAEAPQVNMVV